MLGHFATTVLNSTISWLIVIVFGYMVFTAIRARQNKEEWTQETSRNRRITWGALAVSALVFLN